MRKVKFYLDTTVFNFAFADSEPDRKAITLEFIKNLQTVAESAYISEEVIREVSRAPEPKKSQLEGLIRKLNPILLEINDEIEELADHYVKEGIIPERFRADALHIAAAVTNEIDAIASWNFEHIVKLKTRIMVNGLNKMMGYREIEICSPEEVI